MPSTKQMASIRFDLPARRWSSASTLRVPTRAVRPNDGCEARERADDLLALVRLEVLDLQAVDAARARVLLRVLLELHVVLAAVVARIHLACVCVRARKSARAMLERERRGKPYALRPSAMFKAVR